MEIDTGYFDKFNSTGVYVIIEESVIPSTSDIKVIGVYDNYQHAMSNVTLNRKIVGPVPFHTDMFKKIKKQEPILKPHIPVRWTDQEHIGDDMFKKTF